MLGLGELQGFIHQLDACRLPSAVVLQPVTLGSIDLSGAKAVGCKSGTAILVYGGRGPGGLRGGS